MGHLSGIESSNDLIAQFSVAVAFSGIYLYKVNTVKVLAHSHHMHSFPNYSNSKVVIQFLNQCFMGTSSRLEFPYSSWNWYNSRQGPISPPVSTVIAVSRNMARSMERYSIESSILRNMRVMRML